MKWGVPGTGAWITVYANGGHAYAVIAGLRWDTSAVGEPVNSGSGPRWRATKRKPPRATWSATRPASRAARCTVVMTSPGQFGA